MCGLMSSRLRSVTQGTKCEWAVCVLWFHEWRKPDAIERTIEKRYGKGKEMTVFLLFVALRCKRKW